MNSTAPAALGDHLDEAAFGKFHLLIAALGMLISVTDGYDLLAMAAVAPVVSHEWALPASALGLPLSASLVGVAVGSIFAGIFADRWGRRLALLVLYGLGALATIATMTSATIGQFVAYRFVTGFGFGGTLPLILALAAEYMPRHLRSFVLTVMFAGNPLGAALASFAAGPLVAAGGWPAVFAAGGILPLFVLLLLAWKLPESIRFLALRERKEAVVKLLDRIRPNAVLIDEPLGLRETGDGRAGVLSLLTPSELGNTAALWGVFFCTQLMIFFLASLLPTLFRESGLALAVALQATALYQLGGVVGSVAGGWALDRGAPRMVLFGLYGLAIVALAWLSMAIATGIALMGAAFLVGVGANGAQIALNAYTASIYPTSVRAVGLGWALGIGRIGAIVSPLIGAGLLLAGFSPKHMLLALSVPAGLAALGLCLLKREPPRSAATKPPLPVH